MNLYATLQIDKHIIIIVVGVCLKSWFVCLGLRLEIAEFPDGVHWSAPWI